MTRQIATTQLNLEGGQVTVTRFRFDPGEYDRLREIAEGHRMECEYHYEHLNPTVPAVLYVRPDRQYYNGPPIMQSPYFDPWQKDDEEPAYNDTICRFCADYGLQSESDFGPMYCERCERDVIQRFHSNGWSGYFTSDPEYPEELC